MYTPETFNDKRVILKDLAHSHLNGKRAILSNAFINDMDDIIACTDIPHPEDNKTFLWVNVNSEVSHILEFDSYVYQYRHKITHQTLTIPYEIDGLHKPQYDLIGQFDVYNKIPIVFNLFEQYTLIPANLQEILDRYQEREFLDYSDLAEMLEECELIGYTFEYGLDAEPFNLQKILT